LRTRRAGRAATDSEQVRTGVRVPGAAFGGEGALLLAGGALAVTDRMTDHDSSRQDGIDSDAGSLITGAEKHGRSPTESETGTGGRLARNPPEQHKDVRTQSYQRDRLRRIAAVESSPSAGWRRVYHEMGVRHGE